MKHMRKINNQKGFTLLEMMIAITLIAIGLLATVAMQSVAINSNSIANRSTVVTAIAQEVMEEIMSRDPEHDPDLTKVPGFSWVYDLEPLSPTNDRTVPSAGTYHAVVVTTHPAVNITRVDVTVTRVDDISNKGRQGVAGGGFLLSDFKQVPNTPKDP